MRAPVPLKVRLSAFAGAATLVACALLAPAIPGETVAFAAAPSASPSPSSSSSSSSSSSPSPSPSSAAADAGPPKPARDSGVIGKIPPDPPAMVERHQWVFDLRWAKGDVYLLGVHKVDLPAPQETPRAMGRFAIELFEGPTLIERVRFDFPLLGAGEPLDAGYGGPPRLEPKLVTRIGVMFPAAKRGTRLELWDRATNRRWPLPWPPEETSPAVPGEPRDPHDAG